MASVWTPQWLYRHVTIDSGETIRLDADPFINNEPWPLHLKWLSIAGDVALDSSGDFTGVGGGICRRLQFELSLTQKGDINNLIANTRTLFTDHQAGIPQAQNRYDFSPPFPLGPENGLVVEQSAGDPMVEKNNNPAIMFTGLQKDPNLGVYAPVHLGAMSLTDLAPQGAVTFNSVDLFNNGEDVFWIKQMLLDSGSGDTPTYANQLKLTTSWKINPNSGVQWMPDPLPIPTANLAPLSIYGVDASDVSGGVYVFPKNTQMRPRQRLGVEVKNLSTSTQQFGLCLHGLMEVM